MIHHQQHPPPPPGHGHPYRQHSGSNHQHHHPYDDTFDNRSVSHHPHHQTSRSTHNYHSQQSHRDSMNSPPSFYSIPPPPPAPMTMDSTTSYYDTYHLHSQGPPPPPPPPPSSANSFPMHPPHSPANAFYSAGTTSPHQSYMSNYPPPPPPAPQVISASPTFSTSFDQRDRFQQRQREGVEFSDYKSSAPPFHPLDYQRQFVYEINGPATQNGFHHIANGYSQMNSKLRFPNHSTDAQNRNHSNTSLGVTAAAAAAAAAVTRKGSVSESHAMALSDQQPTYVGHIKSANDAILLLSACDLKWPSSSSMASSPPRRVTRRLLDSERADLVSSGSVFVWDEKEAGMKRWTDGRVWSASRVSGCFLTYRELEARKKIGTSAINDGPCTNQYKSEGLIKQSFSITTTSGRKLHVISYFTKRAVREGRLRRVSEDPRFVGEGGGEWGLKIDDKEYSFPDMTQLAKTGMEGSQAMDLQLERGDDESSSLSDSFEHEATSPPLLPTPLPQPHSFEVSKSTMSASLSREEFDRKRPLPDDAMADPYRALTRPRLARLRSSSMSGLQSFREDENNQSSYNSNTSLATTIPSDSETGFSKVGRIVSQSSHGKSLKADVRSHAVRALLSPTLPKESALRQSACDMKPTQSQDCANAVGALLSLAGNSDSNDESSSLAKGIDTTISTTFRGTSATPTPSSTSSSGQQGINTADDSKGPKRRESDRAALNKFSVRL